MEEEKVNVGSPLKILTFSVDCELEKISSLSLPLK